MIKGLLPINIPYREGMQAYVDGHRIKPMKVNYMMTGVPVNSSAKIIIKYQPPYWNTMILISLISIVISVVFVRFVNTKKEKVEENIDQ